MTRQVSLFTMVTGHRPQKLGGFGSNPIAARVQKHLHETLTALQSRISLLHGLTGMALGCDQWYAELCLSLHIPYIPRSFRFRDRNASGLRHHKLSIERSLLTPPRFTVPLSRASTLSDHDIRRALLDRNTAMVQQSHAAIAIWDGRPSGTGDAVRKLQAADIPTFRIHPHIEVERHALMAWVDQLQSLALHPKGDDIHVR